MVAAVAHAQPSRPAIPPEYAGLHAALAGKLRDANAALAVASGAGGPAAAPGTSYAAELLPANANLGEALFRPQAWPAVMLNLDRLQALGARGVKVAIKYPVLVPGFPQAAEYLAFYRRVGAEVRRRGLVLIVQTTAAFREPVFSALPVAGHYAGLTLERYSREKRQMVETIIREVRPDYLTIENEPGTQSANTGLRLTVEAMVEEVRTVTAGLDKSGVRLGAGVGTWDPLAYVHALAAVPALDFLDLHVYPITQDFLFDRALRMADVARQAGKAVVFGELWLYKARDDELRGAPVGAAPALFARDVYSFWEPLDVEFIATAGRLARAAGATLASFFWSRYFYGYVEYGPAPRALPPAELFRLVNREAAARMLADPPRPTRTGLAFRRLATGGD